MSGTPLQACPTLETIHRLLSSRTHSKYSEAKSQLSVSIPDRYITPDMAKEIMLMYGLHRIIGSRKCFK